MTLSLHGRAPETGTSAIGQNRSCAMFFHPAGLNHNAAAHEVT